MSRNIYLSDERYVAALKRLRAIIASGEKLVAEDSDEIGNKFTECSWGLCSEAAKAWPDAEDHLWPDKFTKEGRIAPKYRRDEHPCPMDKREVGDGNGCFYTCSIFKAKRGQRPTRKQALARYDAMLRARAEKGVGT